MHAAGDATVNAAELAISKPKKLLKHTSTLSQWGIARTAQAHHASKGQGATAGMCMYTRRHSLINECRGQQTVWGRTLHTLSLTLGHARRECAGAHLPSVLSGSPAARASGSCAAVQRRAARALSHTTHVLWP
eukprot:2288378-Prymnesium_polylepis.1